MGIEISHFIQELYGQKGFARVMASSRTLSRYGEGPMAQSYNHSRHTGNKISNAGAKRVEDCKVGAEDLIAQNFDFDCRALMDRNDQRAHLSQTGSSTKHNHGRTDHGLKCRINHGKVIGNIMGGDIRKT